MKNTLLILTDKNRNCVQANRLIKAVGLSLLLAGSVLPRSAMACDSQAADSPKASSNQTQQDTNSPDYYQSSDNPLHAD